MLNFRKVDINDLIFNYMLKVATVNKTCYPYGMHLTRLIRSKGTVLDSEATDHRPIISVRTLIDLDMKTESGNDFIIAENPFVEVVPERVSDDSEDDKPLSVVLSRKRKDVSVP